MGGFQHIERVLAFHDGALRRSEASRRAVAHPAPPEGAWFPVFVARPRDSTIMRAMRGKARTGATPTTGPVVSVTDSHDGRVREITLGGSRGNLLSQKLVEEFRATLGSAAKDRKLKLIVITGEKDNFSYGADVKEHLPDKIAEVLPLFHLLIGELLACDVPTLARVSGYCLGGGFELALACSMLWCDKTAKLGLPEISLGVFPPVAAVLLPEKVSRAVAADLMLSGRIITGVEARALGIANRTLPRSLVAAQLHDFIVTYILPKSASSLRHANAALMGDLRTWYAAQIRLVEKQYLETLMQTHDATEGARAFMEKRAPDWRDS